MEHLDRLRLFITVAQAGSFTKAAAQLGISQSTLSYTIKALEQDLGIALIHRSTRSITTTAAGQKLLTDITPLMNGLQEKLEELHEFCEQPQTTIRLTGSNLVFRYLLADKLHTFRRHYPKITLEIHEEIRFQNISQDGFDAGIRLGVFLAQDVIAKRISADIKMCVAASPDYLAQHGTPKSIAELNQHNCLVARLPSLSNIMPWEFSTPQTQQEISYQPKKTTLISNDIEIGIHAALAGEGLIWLPEYVIADKLASQQLLTVLPEWAICYEGYHLYYPRRHKDSAIFQALLEYLKYQENP